MDRSSRAHGAVVDWMREEDLEEAARIDAVSFAPGEHGRGDRVAQLREELARPWARLRVVREQGAEGKVVGFALFWHVVDEIHLLNIAVAPEHRGRGLGRALLADLVAHGREKGAVKVLLEVRVGNAAAIGLYEAFGFERLGVRKRYYDDGEDAVDMLLALGPTAR